MYRSILDGTGRIILPGEIREHLGLAPGDAVDFVVEDGGHVVVRPARSRLKELYGMLHVKGRPAVSIEEMNAAIARDS